jgi:hypothetical protein
MEEQNRGISRREALKLGGFMALGGAGIYALSGCSPKGSSSTSTSSDDSSSSSSGTITARDHYEWLTDEPDVDESLVTQTVSVDVVILGSGHSGTQCAKSASAAGASVAVLESQTEDTQFYYGEDIGTFNSQYVQDLGYGPYDEMEILEQLKRTGGYRVNPELIKNYIENSGAMADSFIGLVQERNADLLTYMNVQQPCTEFWTDRSVPQDMGDFKTYVGTFCMRSAILDEAVSGVGSYSNIGKAEALCRAYAIEKGAQWFFGTTAIKVIVENGKATGAYGQDADGNYIRFDAKKAVVIALGAFQNNPQMMKEFFRESWELQAKEGTDAFTGSTVTGTRDIGVGHQIGCWAGGRMEAGPMASLANVSAPGPFGFAPTLYLNRDGKRFMNEADFNAIGAQVCRQPQGLYCCIYGNNYEDIIKRGGTNHGGTDFGQPTYVAQWEEDMTKVVAAGKDGYLVRHGCLTERANMQQTRMYGANTLEELAGYLGYEGDAVENIVASVAAYNELVAAGEDTQYGKKPDFLLPIEAPYYGSVASSVGQAATSVTLGGLVTDGSFNILDDADDPIGGLYAIGNCCGGRFALTYPGVLAGNSIGQAMTNGYSCGKIVAAL